MSNLPKHNPVLRALYFAIALVMIAFFIWLFADPNALYYVGPPDFQASDYASCVQAGGELHGSRCYMSETVFFEGDYASCVQAKGELHGSRCYMTETIFFEGDYASCVRAGGEVHGSRCYMSETIFFER